MSDAGKSSIREAYERDGFVFPLRAMGPMETEEYRVKLQEHERINGQPLQARMRHQSHLLFTWAYELIHHPRILDAVEEIIGPNILCSSLPRYALWCLKVLC